MSAPVVETEPAEEQVQEVEVKQETATEELSEQPQPANDDECSTAMEVDSSHKESNPESAAAAGGRDETLPHRRSGASRKRFKWLLDQGYSREAAAEIAKTPFKPKEMREKYIAETGYFKEKVDELSGQSWGSLSDAAKRRVKWLMKNGFDEKEALRLAEESTSSTTKRKAPSNEGPSKRSAEALPGSFVMAVCATDFPKTFLTEAQTDECKSSILKEVVQQKDAELKPHFKSCEHVSGYLRVQCKDQETSQWLQNTVAKLAAPEGVSLKVVTEKNLLKGDVYTGHFPDSRNDSDETILAFVESQNDGLSTAEWTILARKEFDDATKVELMFAVDEASAKCIQSVGYDLNYKFNTVRLRRKNLVPQAAADNGPKPKPVPRRSFNQASTSFVPIWDKNMPRNRGGNNFNRGRGRGYNSYGGGGFNNRRMENGNRPFDLVDSLYDQLNLISGGGNNNNQWDGNRSFRNNNGQGNRNFFTRFDY